MIDLSTLPYGLRPYVRALGVAGAVAFLRARGGTITQLAQSGRPPDWMVGLVGAPAARRLMDELRPKWGAHITFPMTDKLDARTRNAAIVEALDGGATLAAVALEHCLTVRQVCNIQRAHREGREDRTGDLQIDLFGQ